MDTAVLERALAREKARRIRAEELLETKSRELYLSYEKLRDSHLKLEQTSLTLQEKHQQLIDKQDQFLTLNSLHDTVTHDLRLAASLQEQILPDPVEFGEIEARGLSKPAMYVAGDIFDYFLVSENVMAFYIADVTGHGAAAAMVSYSIHKQLNPRADGICVRQFQASDSFSQAVESTVYKLNNDYAGLIGESHYFTFIYGLMNYKTGEVCFSQAGHPSPLHWSKKENALEEVGNGGIPMGMFEDMDYTTYEFVLERGDSVFMYSDGITECFSPDNEEYGKGRLSDVLTKAQHEELSSALEAVDKDITTWNSSSIFGDDVSIFGIKRH